MDENTFGYVILGVIAITAIAGLVMLFSGAMTGQAVVYGGPSPYATQYGGGYVGKYTSFGGADPYYQACVAEYPRFEGEADWQWYVRVRKVDAQCGDLLQTYSGIEGSGVGYDVVTGQVTGEVARMTSGYMNRPLGAFDQGGEKAIIACEEEYADVIASKDTLSAAVTQIAKVDQTCAGLLQKHYLIEGAAQYSTYSNVPIME